MGDTKRSKVMKKAVITIKRRLDNNGQVGTLRYNAAWVVERSILVATTTPTSHLHRDW